MSMPPLSHLITKLEYQLERGLITVDEYAEGVMTAAIKDGDAKIAERDAKCPHVVTLRVNSREQSVRYFETYESAYSERLEWLCGMMDYTEIISPIGTMTFIGTREHDGAMCVWMQESRCVLSVDPDCQCAACEQKTIVCTCSDCL